MPRWALVGMILTSCDPADPRECLPGDYIECTCDAGEPGYAVCDEEGVGYTGCGYCGQSLSGGNGGGPGGGGGTGGTGGAALLPFMSECEEDVECDTGLCYDFNAKGPHCSHSCAMDGDCESPSPGCNMMGICKAP